MRTIATKLLPYVTPLFLISIPVSWAIIILFPYVPWLLIPAVYVVAGLGVLTVLCNTLSR